MRITAPSRSLTALVLVATVLAGCGGTDEDPTVAPVDPTTPTVSTTPAPTAVPTATTKPKPTKKPKPKPPEGDGDAEGDDTPATAGGGICSDLDAGAVGTVLGGVVTGSALPAEGCSFDQKNRRAPAASFVETSYSSTPGGMEGAKTGATSSVEGDPVDLAGIGDAAFVVTGTAFGGTDLQGAGAVRVGDRLINVSVGQSAGLSRAKVRALVVGLLRLAADKIG